MPGPPLILASASPRRQSLLSEAGYVFTVEPAEVDESAFPAGMLPSNIATHVAEMKAKAVSARRPDAVVLAADTVVAFGDMPQGKPVDANGAWRMLALLSGTTHIVITGVSIIHADAKFSKTARAMSAVRMRILTRAEIDQYVAGGLWQGKAGGYGIQDPDPFVIRKAGSHTNIVGLPMELTTKMLAEAGVTPG